MPQLEPKGLDLGERLLEEEMEDVMVEGSLPSPTYYSSAVIIAEHATWIHASHYKKINIDAQS